MPVSGTIVTAGLHINNYTAIQTAINGGLDNNNFAAGKIFDLTKLMQGGARTGQPLVFNGTDWAASDTLSTVNGTATAWLKTRLAVGDANPTFQALGDGSLQFGAGSTSAVDITVSRVAANTLQTNSEMRVIRGLAANTAFTTIVTGDTLLRLNLTADGKLSWGPGNATQDTNLYRDAAGNRLKTDDNFVAVDGVTTKTKAGVPVDGDFQVAPGDGTIVVDTTNNLEWIRVGGVWVPRVGVFDRLTAGSDNQTSVTEASCYTKSVPANLMGTNRMLRLTLFGDFLHNNVAGDTVTLRVKFGGTTFWAWAYPSSGLLGAIRHPWVLVLHVMNLGATNSQAIFGTLALEDANLAAPTTGIGSPGATGARPGGLGISTLAAIDTTAAATLDVTAQWSASSANNSWRTRGGTLEIV